MGKYDLFQAIRKTPMEPTDKLLLLIIATYADREGGAAWPSADRLAENYGCSRRVIFIRLNRLRKLGYLAVQRPASQHRPTTYRIVLPDEAFRGDPEITADGESGVIVGSPLFDASSDQEITPEPSRGDHGITSEDFRGDPEITSESRRGDLLITPKSEPNTIRGDLSCIPGVISGSPDLPVPTLQEQKQRARARATPPPDDEPPPPSRATRAARGDTAAPADPPASRSRRRHEPTTDAFLVRLAHAAIEAATLGRLELEFPSLCEDVKLALAQYDCAADSARVGSAVEFALRQHARKPPVAAADAPPRRERGGFTRIGTLQFSPRLVAGGRR